MWLCAGATIFEVFHRLFEFSIGKLKFFTVCASFQSVNRGFYRSFESSIGESGVLVEKQEVRVEIASFCGGLDIRINPVLLLLRLRSWKFFEVKEVLTDWLLDRSFRW